MQHQFSYPPLPYFLKLSPINCTEVLLVMTLILYSFTNINCQIIENGLVQEIASFATLNTSEQPVRLVYNNANDNFFYNTRFGKIYEVSNNGIVTIKYENNFLQLDEIYGLDFHNNKLYISGVKNIIGDSTWIGYGLAVDITNNAIDTLIKTDILYKGNAFQDHRLNVIKVLPSGNELLIHLASRTNSGELQEVPSVIGTSNLREHWCTAAFFKIPIQPISTILIEDNETWMNNSSYVYATGIRHGFAVDFHNDGSLYVAGNSDRRHVPEPLFKIQANENYLFPWYHGEKYNPLQNQLAYNPNVDTLLAPSSNNQGYYNTDPNYPQNNSGIPPEVLINTGPDADKWKNEVTGQIWDASDLNTTIAGLSGHKSPTDLFWDKNQLLPDSLQGGALITCWTPSSSMYDTGEDLLLMKLLNNNKVRITRLASGFNRPLAVVMKNDEVYILDKTNIWKMTFSLMPLPVELSSFEVRNLDNCIPIIEWNVESEENFRHYEIQRSFDANAFATIEIVQPNTHSRKRYQVKDQSINEKEKTVYYRLKMIDIDGTYEYSEIRSILIKCPQEKDQLKIFPNITTEDSLKIQWSFPLDSARVVIYDIYGKKVLEKKGVENNSIIFLKNISDGQFVIVIFDENTLIGTKRFIKAS